MSEAHFLNLGEYIVLKGEGEIRTLLGSCVGMVLYDKVNKIGGMAHFVLPQSNKKDEPTPFYGNIAFEKMHNEMLAMGAQKLQIRAKIYGGANIFYNLNFSNDVGEENSEFAKKILIENNIPIKESELGGHLPRGVILDCSNYTVRCESGLIGK